MDVGGLNGVILLGGQMADHDEDKPLAWTGMVPARFSSWQAEKVQWFGLLKELPHTLCGPHSASALSDSVS